MSQYLEYYPKWYHLGDPDNPIFAVLYGAVALSTIWMLEYISSRVLYSRAKGILLSDAAAQVTYNSSSLPEFIKWLIKERRPKGKLCRRALFGLFLRYLVLCVDIGILFMSLPRGINVFEYEVGTTQLSYNGQGVNDQLDSVIPCKIDNIEYRGFTPGVSRQICVSGRGVTPDIFSSLYGKDMYIFFQFSDDSGMKVASTLTHSQFTLTHSLRHVSDKDEVTRTSFAAPRKELLPVPDKLFQEAATAFLLNKNYRERCRRFDVKNRTFEAVVFSCRKIPSMPNIKIDINLVSFMMSVGTEKRYSNSIRPIGKLNRPRLCILPALILLAGLSAIAGMLILMRGTQDLAFKQWAHACRTAKKENVDNPLFSEELELELRPDFTIHNGLQSESEDDENKKPVFAQCV